MKTENELPEQTKFIADCVRDLLRGMTSQPEALCIETVQMGRIVTMEITPHPNDQARLVGAKGVHIGAISKLLRAIGSKQGLKIVPTLLGPPWHEGKRGPSAKFRPNPNWKPDALRELLDDILSLLLDGDDYEVKEMHQRDVSVFQVIPGATNEWPLELEAALSALVTSFGFQQGRALHLTGPDPVPA